MYGGVPPLNVLAPLLLAHGAAPPDSPWAWDPHLDVEPLARHFAQEIVISQRYEIGLMTAWLRYQSPG